MYLFILSIKVYYYSTDYKPRLFYQLEVTADVDLLLTLSLRRDILSNILNAHNLNIPSHSM